MTVKQIQALVHATESIFNSFLLSLIALQTFKAQKFQNLLSRKEELFLKKNPNYGG